MAGGKGVSGLFFPSRFLFPLQPWSTDAGSPPHPHGALQREQNGWLGLRELGGWRRAGERCPLAPLPAQTCPPASLELCGSQICWRGKEENRRAESLLQRHLGKFQSSPLPLPLRRASRAAYRNGRILSPQDGASPAGHAGPAAGQHPPSAPAGFRRKAGRLPSGESCAGEAEARAKASGAAGKPSLLPETAKWGAAFQRLPQAGRLGVVPLRALR